MSSSTTFQNSSYTQRLLDYSWIIAFLWVMELIDWLVFSGGLDKYGVRPRVWSHPQGLLFSPFLHGGWGHLIGNSISLLVLGAAILIKGWRDLAAASVVSALAAGLLIFFIGKSGTIHIGASSVVFGYFGFLIGAGYYQRSPLSIILAVLVIIFYGGAVFSMFPTAIVRAGNISWEAHLGGAIGGFLVARHQRMGWSPKSVSNSLHS